MDTKYKNKLADEILTWYWSEKDKIKLNNRFWARDSIGYALYSIMKEEGRWRNKPRGAKHKSFPAKRQLEASNEFDLDF